MKLLIEFAEAEELVRRKWETAVVLRCVSANTVRVSKKVENKVANLEEVKYGKPHASDVG